MCGLECENDIQLAIRMETNICAHLVDGLDIVPMKDTDENGPHGVPETQLRTYLRCLAEAAACEESLWALPLGCTGSLYFVEEDEEGGSFVFEAPQVYALWIEKCNLGDEPGAEHSWEAQLEDTALVIEARVIGIEVDESDNESGVTMSGTAPLLIMADEAGGSSRCGGGGIRDESHVEPRCGCLL